MFSSGDNDALFLQSNSTVSSHLNPLPNNNNAKHSGILLPLTQPSSLTLQDVVRMQGVVLRNVPLVLSGLHSLIT